MNRNKFDGYVVANIAIFPFVLFYLVLFFYGNDFVNDRYIYIQEIMGNPFNGREEPGLHTISYILGFLIKNPELKFMLVHLLFLFLFLFLLSKELHVNTLIGFAKYLFLFMICLSVLSNPFGIQVRIGYGCIFFCFIVFGMHLRPSFKNLIWFLLPCLMHFGLIISVFLYYIFYWFRIDSMRKFLVLILFVCSLQTFSFKFLEQIVITLGISNYYLMYLDSGENFGRTIPFTALFYIISCVGLIIASANFKLKVSMSTKDIDFWYSLSGIVLIYWGWVLGFYLSFKFLLPTALFLYIYLISKINLSYFAAKLLIVLTIVFSPLAYYYFSLQLGYLNV